MTGATGYIGGRLGPRLLARGYGVRCLARSAAKLRARPWAGHPGIEIVEGDAADEELLASAIRGCIAAYYLLHSMDGASTPYRERDRALSERFGRAAATAGVPRIIYLGGVGETGSGLSEHLASRREVETALGRSGVKVTALRAAMIIGSGSASFEILRYLVERLPIMVTPRWVRTESRPIAVRDVLHYLVAALESPATIGRTLDIGGPEVSTYADIMRAMAAALGLRRRLIIPHPILTPCLSSLWIYQADEELHSGCGRSRVAICGVAAARRIQRILQRRVSLHLSPRDRPRLEASSSSACYLVTPLDASIARPLAEGLRSRVVCRNDDAERLMPHPPGQPRLTIR